VLELEYEANFKPGDLLTHETGIYEVADVKPGYGNFDAVIFADLAERESD
jgi:hypothetical protein